MNNILNTSLIFLLLISCKPNAKNLDSRLNEFIKINKINHGKAIFFIGLDECPVCYSEFQNLSKVFENSDVTTVVISRSKVKSVNFIEEIDFFIIDSTYLAWELKLFQSLPVLYKLNEGHYDSIPINHIAKLKKNLNHEEN
ncbi:hypothetical protein [Belliella aquatica]|uniref:Uncharacterized protein n=1 Tax=Belliella aquatica TaxID=1323734 RepID=A0ABQ1M1J1_9BACT|nr:hypothetical protein [Belliella aquatica]MCH7405722.1 hypothetical protein [Belliella aquatica]GGC31259.1 hypothetical protein GCM10010993_07710 [Belliella aquatica]